jgi:hypothetical protein
MTPAARIGAATGRVAAMAARNSPNLFPKSTLHRIITTGPEPDPKKKELVMYGTSYHRSFDDIPRQSAFETAAEEFYDEAAHPVKSMDKAVTAFANAQKGIHNDRQHAQFQENQTPARPHARNIFSTPQINNGGMYSPSYSRSEPYIYNTPAHANIEQRSPPPPADLTIRGNRLPYNPMDFADMAARNPIQKLKFGDEFETPESSPYRKSASSLQKTFKKKPGEYRSGYDTASSPPPPRFRI